MTRYVVFVVDDDEDAWESASDEVRAATYEADERFAKALAERGGRIVGGAELSHSRGTRVLRRGGDGGALVSDGPFAEAVEQVSGFYIVECDDAETLTEACQLMLPAHVRLEIRATPD